jgi:hypothetical protein
MPNRWIDSLPSNVTLAVSLAGYQRMPLNKLTVHAMIRNTKVCSVASHAMVQIEREAIDDDEVKICVYCRKKVNELREMRLLEPVWVRS